MREVTVMLDSVAYDHKPSAEAPEITTRFKHSEPVTIPIDLFAQAVADGRTWCGGCYVCDPSIKFGNSEFLGQQLFAIDIDNDIEVRDEDGMKVKDASGHVVKRPLMPDEPGYLDPWEARGRWARVFHADPFMMYPSMSFKCDSLHGRWSPDTKMKYRMVLDAKRLVTDVAEADNVIGNLLNAFPEADTSCARHSRLYFGSSGKVQYVDGGVTRYARR